MSSTALQIFLLVNVFLIGVATAVAIRHAYAHFRPHPEPEKPHRPAAQGGHLPPAVREKLLQEAADNFQKVLDRSADELQHDLKATTGELNKQLDKLGQRITDQEMERYQQTLEQLRKQTEIAIATAHNGVSTHQADLEAAFTERRAAMEAQLAEELATEKERLITQIDTKLADAVTSFLMETLQHEVDLGAQETYLISMLEQHKDELAKGVKSEV